MADLPSTYTEASYSSTISEVFPATIEHIHPNEAGSFSERYELIDNMLTEDMDIITSWDIENESQRSLPSLIDDSSNRYLRVHSL